jgi:hypothetical protein
MVPLLPKGLIIAQAIATIWSEFYSFTGSTSESIAAKIYM